MIAHRRVFRVMRMRLWENLITSESLVKLTYALCRGWNALTLQTRGAARRRERARAAFAGRDIAGQVNGQRLPPVAALPYGRYTMDYNGCEVIAAHNALLALGLPSTLGDAAAYFERHGLFLGGYFGTHVLAIPDFFRDRGCGTEALFASRAAEFDAAFAGAAAAVFAFWNDPRRLRAGVHTVALLHGEPGGVEVCNLGGRDRQSVRFASLRELTEKTGALPILLVALRKTENKT